METSADTNRFRPTEEQRRAIESISIPMAVDAAAGSGKTRVLIQRIMRIVDDDWTRLGGILAITFTEKAAGELRAKLRPHVPVAERFRLDEAWIGTFHSFCARLLRRFGPAIGLDPSFRLLDENQSGMLSRKCVREALLRLLEDGNDSAAALVEETGYPAAAGAIEELMSFRWHAARALQSRGDAEEWEKAVLENLSSTFSEVQEAYLERLARLGALDFQELETRTLRLLEVKSVSASCKAIFAHILVDEYQDTNDIQTELVLRLFDPTVNRLFIVGDEAQSIYRFRGANVSSFARVRKLIGANGGETVRLGRNFRSRKSIIGFVNATQGVLADGLFSDPSEPKPIEAARPDGGEPHVLRLPVPGGDESGAQAIREREAAVIAETIFDRASSGEWAYGDVVMLFRAMSSAALYEAALRRRNIPCSSIGGRTFLERTEIADLTAALRFAADPEDGVALLTLLRSPIGGMSDDDLTLMAGPDGRSLRKALEEEARLALIAELPAMASHMRPSEILRRVINEAGLELLWAALDPSGAAIANMDRLVTVARDLERSVPTTLTDLNSMIAEMRSRGAKLGEVAPDAGESGAVRLMTVHAAKGLEFPIVFLPDLARRSPSQTRQWIFSRGDAGAAAGVAFKRRDPAKPFGSRIKTERFSKLSDEERVRDEKESKRLLYVAMTRAIETLILPIHEGIKDGRTWHGWIGEALATEEGSEVAEKIQRIIDESDAPHSKGVSTVKAYRPRKDQVAAQLRLSVSQLDSYSVCPMQYYLKYVLGLPASEVTRPNPQQIEPNIYGSIVHAMLAQATGERSALEAAAKSACLASGVAIDSKRLDRLVADALGAIELAGADGIEGGFRELPFEMRFREHTISGTLDWLKPTADGFEIIDYKTGTEKVSKLASKEDQYEVQMQLYSLAAEAITGKKVVATSLVFPAAGRVLKREMDAKRRKAAAQNVEAIVAGIESRDYKIKAKPPCESCIYMRNGMCWERRMGCAKRSRK